MGTRLFDLTLYKVKLNLMNHFGALMSFNFNENSFTCNEQPCLMEAWHQSNTHESICKYIYYVNSTIFMLSFLKSV